MDPSTAKGEGHAVVSRAGSESGAVGKDEIFQLEIADQVVDGGARTEQQLSLRDAFRYYKKAILWSVLISNATIMESYDLILMNLLFAFPAFKQQFGVELPNGTYTVPSRWQISLSMASNVGLIFGVIANGWLSDKWRPRMVMIVCHVWVGAFVFMMFFAQTVEVLLAGVLLLCLPCGVFAAATVNYAAEICPTQLRGYLTTYVNLCWVMGHLIAAGVLNGTLKVQGHWSYRIPFAVQWAWPLPLIVICWLAPESPWWLARKGRFEEARASIKRVCSAPSQVVDPDHTIAMINETLRLERENMKIQGTYWDCFTGTNLRRTEIAIVSWGGQILPGFVIQNYSTYFFTLAGLPTGDSFKIGLGNYSIAFVGTVASWFIQTRFGRRPMYLTGVCLMGPTMWIVGFLELKPTDGGRWAQVAIIMIWFLLYATTIGPIAFSIGAEVGASRLRNKTISLGRNAYYVLSILNTVIAPYMLNPANGNLKGKAAFLPAALTLCMIVWTYFRLPETKNMTPETLDHLFETRTPARKFAEEAKKFQQQL